MATAKHRAMDYFRRNARVERKRGELGREFAEKEMAVPDFEAALDDHVGDDLPRLIFVSCHPVLLTEGRIALTDCSRVRRGEPLLKTVLAHFGLLVCADA